MGQLCAITLRAAKAIHREGARRVTHRGRGAPQLGPDHTSYPPPGGDVGEFCCADTVSGRGAGYAANPFVGTGTSALGIVGVVLVERRGLMPRDGYNLSTAGYEIQYR